MARTDLSPHAEPAVEAFLRDHVTRGHLSGARVRRRDFETRRAADSAPPLPEG
ncbi:hypothetical protein [Streptomyces venezuelae]|uniref:hypothetical protein n=1 Tax=Streptomyces venezuelae TaxID=54571 RepID=UPI00332A9FF3